MRLVNCKRGKKVKCSLEKKGFTLIELLAVLVILAVITLIATPLVMNVVDNAKKEAVKENVYGIIKSGELRVARSQDLDDYDGEVIDITDGTLEYKGTIPKAGVLAIRNDGKIRLEMNDGEWCTVKDYDESEVTIIKKATDCDGEQMIAQLATEAPVLKDGMIPIIFDSNGNTVKANLDSEWYNYGDKRWANAVSVTNESRSKYQNAADGTIISNADILGYFVWIPRYRYRLWNADNGISNEQEIQVRFEKKGTLKSSGDKNGQWLTHPAFTFGETELAGIWVGKFETTGTVEFPTIKPNSRSFTNRNNWAMFNAIRKISTTGNYGLSSYDAHLMKNMEWGAVAYLTQSKYGRCTDGTCSEVWINNVNTGYGTGTAVIGKPRLGPSITGCAGDSVNAEMKSNMTACETGYDYKQGGVNASTTGNITGIYDMRGGAWDLTMGVMKNASGKIIYSSSGFSASTMPDRKYYDLYETTSVDRDFSKGKLGDATRETLKVKDTDTSGWYQDYSIMLNTYNPWFYRGGGTSNGSGAGIFAFTRHGGINSEDFGSRVVVVAEF